MYADLERPLDVPQFSSIRLEKSRLNIVDKARVSRLPWRGQFSPQLVEYLIEKICPDASVILDPFCGSGTVLFEAAQRKSIGVGVEVNPAAWHLASLSSLSGLSEFELKRLKFEMQKMNISMGNDGLFRQENSMGSILGMAKDTQSDPMLYKCITAAILLGMGNASEFTEIALNRGMHSVNAILDEVGTYEGSASCHLADARCIPLERGYVDAVITSPPYINVFNYHQNYRPAAELLGWNPLIAARSEIGANRKYRQNRFLTVVQYCLDMAQVLNELSRVCRQGAPVIFVVGRESSVLGCSFRNSHLLKSLMDQSAAYEVVQVDERVFTNRYGQKIYEDLIIARRCAQHNIEMDYARDLGREALASVINSVSEKNRASLISAISTSGSVQPSPLLV